MVNVRVGVPHGGHWVEDQAVLQLDQIDLSYCLHCATSGEFVPARYGNLSAHLVADANGVIDKENDCDKMRQLLRKAVGLYCATAFIKLITAENLASNCVTVGTGPVGNGLIVKYTARAWTLVESTTNGRTRMDSKPRGELGVGVRPN